MNVILSQIIIYIIFLLLISINYYIFSVATSKFIIHERTLFIHNILEGLVNGGIAVAVELLAKYWFKVNNFYIILSLSIFIVIRTWPVFLGTIIPSIIAQWFFNTEFQYSEIFILVFVTVLLFILNILETIWFHNIKMKFYLIPINLLAIIIVIILTSTVWKETISLVNYVGPMVFLTCFLFIYIYVLSFWKSANSLIDVGIYDFDRFYRIKTSSKALGAYIKNNRIHNGIFLMLSLKSNNNQLEVDNKEVVLKNIEKYFDKFNSIYFKISKNEYGIFFSLLNAPNIKQSIHGNVLIKRYISDALQEIEQTIMKFNESINQDYLFGAVVYGIQESDFNSAFDKARFALSSSKITGKNVLSLFNPYYYNKYKKDILLIRKLNKEVLVSHVSTKFRLCITNKMNVANLYVSIPSIPKYVTNINIEQILSFSEQVGTASILIRYLAAETIRYFGYSQINVRTKIMLRYSSAFLSTNNFNIDVFINIIKFNNVNPNNVVLILKLNGIKSFAKNPIFRKNINFLRSFNIGIAVSDFDYIYREWKIPKYIDPSYILINNWFYGQKSDNSPLDNLIILSKTLNAKTVAHQIHDKKEWNNIIDHNIDILCGDYIQSAMSHPIEMNREQKLKMKRRIYEN